MGWRQQEGIPRCSHTTARPTRAVPASFLRPTDRQPLAPRQNPPAFPRQLIKDAGMAFQSSFLSRLSSWMSNWINSTSPWRLWPQPWMTARSSTSAGAPRQLWPCRLEVGPWSTS